MNCLYLLNASRLGRFRKESTPLISTQAYCENLGITLHAVVAARILEPIFSCVPCRDSCCILLLQLRTCLRRRVPYMSVFSCEIASAHKKSSPPMSCSIFNIGTAAEVLQVPMVIEPYPRSNEIGLYITLLLLVGRQQALKRQSPILS
jgi:hypothetical protein